MTINPKICSIERATHRGWDEWLNLLNGIQADKLDHHEIASQVLAELDGKLDNVGWWAQSVAVAYEQHIGRHIPGQRSDGTFQMSVSKSTHFGMQDLMSRWVNFAAKDKVVIQLIAGDIRVSGTDKRMTWRAKAHDGSSIIVISESKTDGSASIIATQIKLPTADSNIVAKLRWEDALKRFMNTV